MSFAKGLFQLSDFFVTIFMPVLSAADVHRAYDLYGIHPEYVCWKMVKKKASRAVIYGNLILDEKKQMLYTDIMHIDGSKVFVTVCDPLQLMLHHKLEQEKQQVLGIDSTRSVKLLADGTHDKFKSRMVMTRNEQDPDMYPDRLSPSIAIHSLPMCLAVAAYSSMYIGSDGLLYFQLLKA